MCEYIKSRRPQAWRDEYAFDDGDTAYDLAHLLWTYHGKEADALLILGAIKGEVAKSLLEVAPNHPSAVAELIVNRWPETRVRAAEIERDLGENPQIAYALARAYRGEKRFADAARLLEGVIAISPDTDAYTELAEMYKQQGDADKWLEIYDKYLAGTEQFGLEHARKCEQIAYTLMAMKKLDRALPYAKTAADSYSGWGLHCCAACLMEMGRFEEAEQIEKQVQESYPSSFCWYRFCATTNRGDLASARESAEQNVPELESLKSGDELNELALYLQMEGKNDRARRCWEREKRNASDTYNALQLAMLDLEEGKNDDAELRCDVAGVQEITLPPQFAAMVGDIVTKPDRSRAIVYGAALEEVKRCLRDVTAVPRRAGPTQPIFDAIQSPYRTNAAYFLGRLCELRGKKDDARFWYRTAMETEEWTASCRPQAALGLRRLGEEFYK
jgi:tetratricopeptide (TPR) repeat protein